MYRTYGLENCPEVKIRKGAKVMLKNSSVKTIYTVLSVSKGFARLAGLSALRIAFDELEAIPEAKDVKTLKSVILVGREKYDGFNFYHTVNAYINGKFAGRCVHNIGSGTSNIRQTGLRILQANGYFLDFDVLASGIKKDSVNYKQWQSKNWESFHVELSEVKRERDL